MHTPHHLRSLSPWRPLHSRSLLAGTLVVLCVFAGACAKDGARDPVAPGIRRARGRIVAGIRRRAVHPMERLGQSQLVLHRAAS